MEEVVVADGNFFMMGVFVLHETLTPHNTGDFLKQTTMELVISIERDIMA
jgi:hypothetical protein